MVGSFQISLLPRTFFKTYLHMYVAALVIHHHHHHVQIDLGVFLLPLS
jgi:hypothetical protein